MATEYSTEYKLRPSSRQQGSTTTTIQQLQINSSNSPEIIKDTNQDINIYKYLSLLSSLSLSLSNSPFYATLGLLMTHSTTITHKDIYIFLSLSPSLKFSLYATLGSS